MSDEKKDTDVSSIFDGIVVDVKIKGDITVDVVIDNELFQKLPPTVQKAIIKIMTEYIEKKPTDEEVITEATQLQF